MSAMPKPLLLMSPEGKKFIVKPLEGMKDIPGLGVVDTDRLPDSLPNSSVIISGKDFFIAEASLPDILACLKRGPQIIMLKDAAQIIMSCGIGPMMRVLEVGSGSGALTIALAYHVGEGGKIVSYESNPKHADIAARNIALAGMDGIVELRREDAALLKGYKEFDAIVLDMPEPASVLGIVTGALRTGRYICAYLPTMNQVETTIKAMREMGLAETHALENIQREIVVSPGGTRPSFEMLGHTGYLCFGRKVTV